MDVSQKKQEVLEDIARGPESIVFARIAICDEVQLSDLLKLQFIPKLREAANTSHTNTDSLHEVCTNLAKQRAVLHGAAIGEVLSFRINDGTAATRADGTAAHNTTGSLSFPTLEDASYSNKTTFGYNVLHDFNDTGGVVTLSSTSNANTSITDDDGNAVKYFTDFSKYFLTAGRANGGLISIDENTAPYSSPTGAEPFLPANTINGVVFRGTAINPTANTDARHEFTIVANTSGGNAGGDLDIAENKYVGNTFVTLELSNVSGTFTASETLTDFEGETATIKTYSNTSTVLLESTDAKGTFTVGETLSDSTTNATISSIESASNTSINIKLTGNTFLTGSNTDVTLGFSTSNTISLDTGAVSRSGSTVTIIANNHGIGSGERVVLKGAVAAFGEFNDTFIVQGVTANTLSFVTSNATSVSPTGDFSLVKNIIFGQTSNASAAIFQRTVNASANIVFQSSNLSTGFAIGNTVSNDVDSTGIIDSRTIGGAWYQTKTAEVKTYYTTSTSGTWNYDASNNPLGIESTANVGLFWLDNFKPVKINQLVASSSSGNTFVAPKIVLDIALATSSDTSGGYDATEITRLPGTYFAYPMKTYADQTHDGTVTLEAYDNFANVIIAPEGLEINFDWKPLANTSGIAVNTTHITSTGDPGSGLSAYVPEEVTLLNETEFNAHLGPYGTLPSGDDIYLSSNSSVRSNGKGNGTLYPSVNANPFFPAIAGTHKDIADTDNNITGTQPGSLTANDIYAGSYTQIDTGGVDPGTVGSPLDYRFVIQNDLKWVYATSPFAANSSGSSSTYNVPQAAAFLPTVFDGSLDTEIGAASGQSADGTSGSTVVTIPADAAVVCTTVAHANNGNTGVLFTSGVVGARSNMVLKDTQGCELSDYVCSDGTDKDETACLAVGGGVTWGPTAGTATSSVAEFSCLYNRVQAVMTSAGGALSVGSTSGMETNFAIFYQLLLDLISASYGKDYEDPVELTAAGSYTELGRSDASLKTAVETMKSRVDTVIGLHNTERLAVISAMAGSSAYTHPGGYKTAYDSMISYLGNFRSAVGNRILEISNRIGYLNGKNVASGGSNFTSSIVDYLLLNGTDGSSTDEGDNILCEPVLDNALIQMESEVSASISVGSAGDGFTGYSFNSGSGYANTIYSHANFLAGKKIKLIAKILSAIEDVDAAYTQITSKRGEYYEYNQ